MKKLKRFLLYFGLICLCFFIVDKFVNADTISSYSTRYFWCTVLGDTVQNCQYTAFRSGSDNKLTAYGLEEDSPRYSQYETFNGMNNLINVSLTSGSTYTFNIDLIYSNVGPNEWGPNNLSRFETYKYFNAGIIANVSTSYNKSSNCFTYSGSQYCDYNVSVVYTIIPNSDVSSFYLGSYTTDDKTFGLDRHYLTSVIRVNNISYSVNNDSTIVNQNETIINQNETIINQNQELIDNQNAILEQEQENANICTTQPVLNWVKGKLYNTSGILEDNNSYYYTDRFYAKGSGSLTISNASNSSGRLITYDKSGNFLEWYTVTNRTISINSRVYYVAISSATTNPVITFNTEVCQNRLDALNDSLTDTSSPSTPDFGNSLNVSTITPITDLLTMPISLYTKIMNEGNKSCSPYTIPFGLVSGSNYNLTLPCIDIGDYLGDGLKGTIDGLMSIFMIYSICMLGVTIFNDATSLKDNFSDLYGPKITHWRDNDNG